MVSDALLECPKCANLIQLPSFEPGRVCQVSSVPITDLLTDCEEWIAKRIAKHNATIEGDQGLIRKGVFDGLSSARGKLRRTITAVDAKLEMAKSLIEAIEDDVDERMGEQAKAKLAMLKEILVGELG